MGLLLLAPLVAWAATVEVVVAGVRTDEGQVRVAICDERSFLQPSCAHVGVAAAHPGEVTVRVEGVPAGVWAAQAFHDANGNGRLDTNLVGMPTEGLGFSNDARPMFGPPRFGDAAFQVSGADGRIRITLHYY